VETAGECNNVIDIRLRRIVAGRVNAADEARLMVSKKGHAALEVRSMLMNGGKTADVIDFYRKHVAANVERLS
jgi:hypothetical protein